MTEELDRVLEQGYIAKSNWTISKMCNQFLNAEQKSLTPARLERMKGILDDWWQQWPANVTRVVCGQDKCELSMLVFFTYAYITHLTAPRVPPVTSFDDCNWNALPLLTAPPPWPNRVAGIYPYLLSLDVKEFFPLLRRWSHSKRWYERITRLRLCHVVPSPTGPTDPLVGMVRTHLEKAFLQADHSDTFFTQGRQWVQGSLFSMAARDDYVRDKPYEGQTTPMAKLYHLYVSEEKKKAMTEMLDSHPVKGWTELSRSVQELWLLNYYCYAFDQYTMGKIRFQTQYVILWHQWDQPHSNQVLLVKERLHRPALPVLCALGGDSWGVLSGGSEWRVGQTLCHALAIWMQEVTAKHNGVAENGSPIWTCDLHIPRPLEPGAEAEAEEEEEKEEEPEPESPPVAVEEVGMDIDDYRD